MTDRGNKGRIETKTTHSGKKVGDNQEETVSHGYLNLNLCLNMFYVINIITHEDYVQYIETDEMKTILHFPYQLLRNSVLPQSW